jgi:hypothetical protein
LNKRLLCQDHHKFRSPQKLLTHLGADFSYVKENFPRSFPRIFVVNSAENFAEKMYEKSTPADFSF